MCPSTPNHRVRVAQICAQTLLAGLPRRWAHTVGVADRAAELVPAVRPDDRDLLLSAAWLHDIGYSPRLTVTGFHPLDGARYLAEHGWPRRLVALVAHHSEARFTAREQGLAGPLAGYPRESSAVADALAAADQSTGPAGEPMDLPARMADSLRRHGPDSAQTRVHHLRGPRLLAAAERVAARLAAARVSAGQPG